ncbi:MAG TPA: hypothetical protein VHD36_11930 [Pirellulales bacterium]|nr:hypothetical protein [Pirellulales bacterium]
MFKSLLLASLPVEKRATILSELRGGKAHDYGWLKQVYNIECKASIPANIQRSFRALNSWTTEMRYDVSRPKPREVHAFMSAVAAITDWLDGRIS